MKRSRFTEEQIVRILKISDKLAHFGENSVVGLGEHHDIANRLYPQHLYTGITLLGEFAQIPPNMKIGRNCIVRCNAEPGLFTEPILQDGESL